eukprot:gene17509-19259_t
MADMNGRIVATENTGHVPEGAVQSQMYPQAGGFYMSPAFSQNQRAAFAVQQPQMAQSIRPRWQAQNQIRSSGGYVQPHRRHPRSTHPTGAARGVAQQTIAGMIQPQRQQRPPKPPVFKLSQSARNQPDRAAVMAQRLLVAVAQDTISDPEPLSASILTQKSANDQKQMIGERLFPLVQKIEAHQAEKIVDMLLEIDNSELLEMLDSTELLHARVNEAIRVLQAHRAKETEIQQAPQGRPAFKLSQIAHNKPGAVAQDEVKERFRAQVMLAMQVYRGEETEIPQGRPACRLSQNAHNKPGATAAMVQQPVAVAQDEDTISDPEPWSAYILNKTSLHDQKQVIGKRLFPLVQKIDANQAEMITGMLLKTNVFELLFMLESTELLCTKVNEAIEVLKIRPQRPQAPSRAGLPFFNIPGPFGKQQ